MTILLETGDIKRFGSVGNYSSYCRCVESKRVSNERKKGVNNRKNGNAYLSWAFIEASNHAINSYPEIKKYYQRKLSKTMRVIALKTIANKLSKACYFILRDNVYLAKKEKLIKINNDSPQEKIKSISITKGSEEPLAFLITAKEVMLGKLSIDSNENYNWQWDKLNISCSDDECYKNSILGRGKNRFRRILTSSVGLRFIWLIKRVNFTLRSSIIFSLAN